MSVRVKILDKEYEIRESIKNVKKTFEMQKDFVKLGSAIDDKDTNKAINANINAIDGMVKFILDVVPDKKLTTDKIYEEMSYEELGEKVQEIISKLLHFNDEEEKKGENEEEK